MADGPNYEQVFTKMQVFHGGNAEDVKHIVRFLHFFRGSDAYELYAKHYLPMLAPEVAAQFAEVKPEVKEETVTETTVTEVPAAPEEPTVTETTTTSISAPKKKGRPSKK